ncbi:hypothetical protein [Cupriavidus sp. UYPR2.512]|uniref:hypothetical protein n=1 Tax=Cupriavidus sp. UYPR2.512 TaxID=1080187 RepID=UPI000366DF33|nr:hypothetical protein [Cupriavidus sp. UYPR2.512]UIF90924.1 hypothetical protein KAF44_32585 [Cupriavidus necator]
MKRTLLALCVTGFILRWAVVSLVLIPVDTAAWLLRRVGSALRVVRDGSWA